VRCEQEVDGGRDVYVVPTPAVLTVKEGLNLPRYPSVPGRMRAGRKPIATSTPTRPPVHLELVRLEVPPGQGRRAEVLGTGPSAAPLVVEMMRNVGVL
jgi:electron transfer flavoprotein beta subunit